jgi:AraC-like DNA-binding protein
MNTKPSASDFQVGLGQGGSLARRKTDIRPDGLYLFEDDIEIKGVLRSTVVTCKAWLLELYDLHSGQLSFTSDEKHIRPQTTRFGILYAPFSMCELVFQDVKGHLAGIASHISLPEHFSTKPIIFDSLFQKPPGNVEEVFEILKAGVNPQSVDRTPRPSLLSLKAKRIIDENYLVYPSISRIAARLDVRVEHLSRQFKKDFKMSPSSYLRQLRVADAPLRLAQGEEIINVSQEVGYNDLSRFYKQFRQTTETSPGACKAILRSGQK